MAPSDLAALLDDPDLEGMSDDEKRAIVNSRISQLRSALAGVMIQGATNKFTVDVPGDQRRAQQELFDKQERSLRGTLGGLREILGGIPEPEDPATPPTE